MKTMYISTRDPSIQKLSQEAILQGLSEEGGLFVLPEDAWQTLDLARMKDMSYQEIAQVVLAVFLPDFTAEEIGVCVKAAYEDSFGAPTITPVIRLDDGYVCELFHGPTCAFKDVALQLLPHLMKTARRKQNLTAETWILTATSGDTGKAALEGFRNVEGIRIVVFYPQQGVSPMQKRQMMTQTGDNTYVCAIEGNFDDAQRGIKAVLHDPLVKRQLREEGILVSSANSINIGRLAAQTVYYVYAYMEMVRQHAVSWMEPIRVVVPTGNFGNILSAYYAGKLGVPIQTLVCASNQNRVLNDFISDGVYDVCRPFFKTCSPSMDILISSNLERLLFDLTGGQSEAVKGWMEQLQRDGYYRVTDDLLSALQSRFRCGYTDDRQTLATIEAVFETEGYLLDPHTAVAYHVMQKQTDRTLPYLVMATASPYKFADTVLEALQKPAGANPFDNMRQLHRLSGVPIPESLLQLEQRPILHTDAILPEDMKAYVLHLAQQVRP